MSATGISWAVNGDAYGTDAGCAAVHGKMMNANAQGRAIWGEAPSSGYAGYFSGRVNVTGNLCAANVVCPSDMRLKDRIHPLDGALESVVRLQGVGYRWSDEARLQRALPDGEQIGLLAQEVQKVLPQAVQDMGDGYLAVDYSRLVPLLIEAIKEQQHQIEELRSALNLGQGTARAR